MFVCCVLQQEAPCALAAYLTPWASPSYLPMGARVTGRPAWQLCAWRPGNIQRLCCSQPTYLGQYQGRGPEFLLVSLKAPIQWEGKTPVLPLAPQSYQPRELPLKSSCIAQRRTQIRNKGVIFAYTARFPLPDIRNYSLIMNACCPFSSHAVKPTGQGVQCYLQLYYNLSVGASSYLFNCCLSLIVTFWLLLWMRYCLYTFGTVNGFNGGETVCGMNLPWLQMWIHIFFQPLWRRTYTALYTVKSGDVRNCIVWRTIFF